MIIKPDFDVLFDFTFVELPKKEEEEVTPEPEVRKSLYLQLRG